MEADLLVESKHLILTKDLKLCGCETLPLASFP